MPSTAWWEDKSIACTAALPAPVDAPIEIEERLLTPECSQENAGISYYTKEELLPGVPERVIRAVTMMNGLKGLYLMDCSVPCGAEQIAELTRLSKVCVVHRPTPLKYAEKILSVFPMCERLVQLVTTNYIVFPLRTWENPADLQPFSAKVYGFSELVSYRNAYHGLVHNDVNTTSRNRGNTNNGAGILYEPNYPLCLVAFGKIVYAAARQSQKPVYHYEWIRVHQEVKMAETEWLALQNTEDAFEN